MKSIFLATAALFSFSSFADEMDIHCFGDIQDLVTKEHVQAKDANFTIKKDTTKNARWETKTLVTSNNYAIKITAAGGLMVTFYRTEKGAERFLGVSTIPDEEHSWINFNHSDDGYALSGSCRVKEVRR